MAGRPVRADARENQRRILEAATTVFAESGEAWLNEIARRAVGPGTLYRHFPTREALILAVYRQEIQALADLAPALLAKHPPVQALRLWLDQTARYGQLKYGAAAVIHAATSAGLESEAYALVTGAISALLGAGQQALLRPDVDPGDFLLLISFLWRIPPGPGARAQAARMIGLVLDGVLPAASRSGSGRSRLWPSAGDEVGEQGGDQAVGEYGRVPAAQADEVGQVAGWIRAQAQSAA